MKKVGVALARARLMDDVDVFEIARNDVDVRALASIDRLYQLNDLWCVVYVCSFYSLGCELGELGELPVLPCCWCRVYRLSVSDVASARHVSILDASPLFTTVPSSSPHTILSQAHHFGSSF